MNPNLRWGLWCALLMTLLAPGAWAQPLSIPAFNTPVTENFDATSAVPPFTPSAAPYQIIAGSYVSEDPSIYWVGPDNGSANGGSDMDDFYSFGSGPDRALGTRQSMFGDRAIGVMLRNNTGQTITCLNVSFNVEQWGNIDNFGGITIFDGSYKTGPNLSTDPNIFTAAGYVPAPVLNMISGLGNTAPCMVGTMTGSITPVNVNTVNFQLTGFSLPNGEEIFLRWTAPQLSVNCDGHALGIDDLTVTATTTPPPTAITTTITGGCNPFTVEANWNQPVGVSSYDYELYNNATFTPPALLTSSAPAPPVSLGSLPNGTYYLRVRSNSACGVSTWATHSFTLSSSVGPLVAGASPNPACLDVATSLTANLPANVVFSSLAWETGPAAAGPFTPIAGATTVPFNYTQTAAGTEFIRLAYQAGTCPVEYTTPFSLTTTAPTAPAGVNAVGVTGCPPTRIQLSYTALTLPLITNYTIQVATDAAFTAIVYNNTSNTNPRTTPVLGPGTYFYRIRANYGAPSCPNSAWVVGAAPIVLPAAFNPGLSIASPTLVCINNNSQLVLIGSNGNVQWQQETACNSGTWNNIVGATSATYPLPNFTAAGEFCYRAVVTLGACAPNVQPRITITVKTPPTANAGANQNVCGTTATLAAAALLPGETGMWSVVQGLGTFVNASSPTTTVNGLDQTQTNILRWTVDNGACPTAFDDMNVNARQNPSTAVILTAGPVNTCNDTLTLQAQPPAVGTGTWVMTASAGPATLVQTGADLSISGLITPGSYTFRWRVTNAPCPLSQAFITVVRDVAGNPGVSSAVNTNVCAGNSASLFNLTASGSLQWQTATAAPCVGPWVDIPGATAPSYLTPPLNVGDVNCFRLSATAGSCPAQFSNVVTITIGAPAVGGTTAPATQSVCQGLNSGSITVSGHTGSIIRWEYSSDNVTWFPITITTPALPFSNLFVDTFFRAVVQNAGCPEAYSTSAFVQVIPAPIGGNIGIDQTLCAGQTYTFNLAGHSGNVLRWEFSFDGFSTVAGSAANTTTTLTTPPLTAMVSYRAVVGATGCPEAYSNVVTLTVVPAGGGTLTPALSQYCGSSGARTLTAAGFSGTILNWEKSTDCVNFSAPIVIPNTTPVYTEPAGLTTTTCYRVVTNIATCPYSTVAEIRVNANSVGGALAGAPALPVCAPTATIPLTLGGYTGTIVRWERSIDNQATWQNIGNAGNATLSVPPLTATAHYRVRVQSGTCPAVYSSIATISIAPTPVAGTIMNSNAATVCSGSNGILSLVGYSGMVQRWEVSTDNFASFNIVTTNNPFLQYSLIQTTTSYRAVLGTATCPPVTTAPYTLTVTQATQPGTITGPGTVCSGTNTGTLSLTGNVGSVLRWESSVNSFNTVTTITNVTTNNVFSNLTVTTRYRALVQNGGCAARYTEPFEVFVVPPAQAGTLGGTPLVCGATNTATLTLTGFQGLIVRWESSFNNFLTASTINHTLPTYTANNLNGTTQFRVAIGGPGCPEVYSNVFEVQHSAGSVGGTASANPATVCANTNTTLMVSGNVGSVIRWERSARNCLGPWTSIPNSANAMFPTALLTETTCYRAVTQNGACPVAFSSERLVTVADNVVTRVDVTDVTCAGSTDGRIEIIHTATNAEFSIDGGFSFNPNSVFANLAAGTYNVVVRDLNAPACPTVIPNVIISEPAQALSIVSIQPITLNCASPNGGAIDLTVSGGRSPYLFRWSNNSQSEDLVNVAPGTYSVTVTDQNGCVRTASATLIPGSNINVAATIQNVRCNGGSDGSIVLNVTNGLPPYNFAWNPGGPNASTRSGLAAGTYSVTVTDGAGCTAFRSLTVTQPLPIIANMSSTPTTCPTAAAGTATASPIGGTAPFTYLWSTGGTTSLISGLVAGAYSVTITDVNGCTASNSVNVAATQTAPATPAPVASPASICGSGTSTLSVTPAANTLFTWYESATTQNSIGSGATFQVAPINTATYFVAATNTLNPTCVSARGSVTVTVSTASVGGSTSGAATVCSGNNSGSINLTGNVGSVVRWEASTNNFASVSQTFSNTTAALTYSNLTQTTSYRAVVKNGGCSEVFSSATTVTVGANCGGIVTSLSSIDFGSIVPACDVNPRSYTVSGTGLVSPIEILAPPNFEVALDAFGPYVTSLSLGPVANQVSPTTVYVRMQSFAAPGPHSGVITHTSTNVSTVNVAVSGTAQSSAATVITATPNPLNLGSSALNTPSTPVSYQLTIQNPTPGFIFLSVGAPFSIAQTASGPFSSSLVFQATSCQTFTATIFVRFTPTAAGLATGSITHTNDLANFSLPVSGTGQTSTTQQTVVTNPNFNPSNVPPGRTFGVDAFADLQEAVNNTASGGRVILDGPTHFGDNVTIPRPMTIEGSGPGVTTIRPRTNTRNTYPTGDPSQALDPAFQHKHGFIIQSHDVTIRNLTISGDPSLDCPERFGAGIINDNRTGVPYNNVRIENVSVEYVYSKGIQLYNTGEKHSIRNSRVDDVCLRFDPSPSVYPTAAGIFVNDPAEIEDNVVTRAGTGIWVEGDFGATAGVSTIRRNQISDMEAAGIYADLRPANVSNSVVIAGNTITSIGSFGIDARGFDENAIIGGSSPTDRNVINIRTRAGRGPGVGLRLSYSLGALVQNIEINAEGLESGMWLLHNTDPNRRVRITEAFIRRIGAFASNPPHGRSNGLFMSELGQYLDGVNGESYAHIWNSEISGFNAGVFTNENGLRDVDLLMGGTTVSIPSVTIFNNDFGVIANGRSQVTVRRNVRTIRDNRIGVHVFGGELVMEGSRMATNQTGIVAEDKMLNNVLYEAYVTVENSLFEGNGRNIENRSQRPVQASFNFWGTNNAAIITSSMLPTVSGIDFSPWFDTSTDVDNNLTNGFDPDYSYVHIDSRSYQTGGLNHLQEAVNDTRVMRVFVNDGSYTGNATINRDISLNNDGAAPYPTFASLSMNGANARARMERSFNVSSSLTLTNGLIDVQNNGVLQLNLGSVLTGGSGSSYVIGNLARQSASMSATDLAFPIGSNSAYRPVTLQVAQQSSATNTYTGRVNEPNTFSRALPSGVMSASTVRSWTFSQTGSSGIAAYQFTGAYGSDDLASSTPADMALLKDEGASSTTWTNLNGTANGSPSGTINVPGGFLTLGNFVLGSRNASGPVSGGLNLMAVINVTTSSAIPTWSSLNCAGAQYELRYRVKGSALAYTTVTATTTFSQLNGLQHNTTYEVNVRGRCVNQAFTPWSTGTVTEFTTLSLGDCSVSGVPPAPGNVHVNMITANTAMVNWRRATTNSTQGYIIAFGDAQLNPNNWPQFVVCNPAQSFLISGLTPSRTYGVRIRTNCSNCTTAMSSFDRRSDWTPVQQFTTLSSKDAMDAAGASQAVSVYPNPTNGQFTVRLDAQAAGETRLTLTDVSGRVILDRSQALEAGRTELNFSLEGYSAGLYLLRVRLDGTDRFVKVVLE